MYPWKIVVDSSSDMHEGFASTPEVGFAIAPLTVQIDGMSFIDEAGIDVERMMRLMETAKGTTSSACPSPDAWAKAFADGEQVFAITISSALSGSYNAACIGRELALEANPDCKICVIDSRQTAGSIVLIAEKIKELIAKGLPFAEIEAAVTDYAHTVNILFTLSSFNNLVKNGRMHKIVGVLAKTLQMRIVGTTTPQGEITVIHKCRGEQQTLTTLVKEMQEKHGADLCNRHVVMSHCFNPKLAATLKHMLEQQAPGIRCTIQETHALTSYYAENSGLIVSY